MAHQPAGTAAVGSVALALLVALASQACSLAQSAAGRSPCWIEDPDFAYVPTTLEGVLRADPADQAGLWLELPNGREVDVGWPDGFSVEIGPGRQGVVTSQFGLVVARSGQWVTLWGGLVRAEGAPRAPASPGRDGFKACEINGHTYTPPPDLNT